MDAASTFTGTNGKTYDKLDQIYTNKLKEHFECCEEPVKEEFIKISKIITQPVFNRNELLDITDYVDLYFKQNNNSNRTENWFNFTNAAFNFRPWQGW